MAMMSSKRNSNSSNNYASAPRPMPAASSSVSHNAAPAKASLVASCYSTVPYSTEVQGFHYCTTGAEGYPSSPPGSPRRNKIATGSPEASRAIAKECERLLCGDMKRIFLGGRTDSKSVSRSMTSIHRQQKQQSSCHEHEFEQEQQYRNDMRFVEVWDYVGGTSYRGFVLEKQLPRGNVDKTLFLFFEHLAGTQLKAGLMALIELASECFECDRLVICLERNGEGLQGLVRDLGWVGFELVTLSHWIQNGEASSVRSSSFSSTSTMSSIFSDDDVTSEKWLYMGMEL